MNSRWAAAVAYAEVSSDRYIDLRVAAELCGASSRSALYQFLWNADSSFMRAKAAPTAITHVAVEDVPRITATMYALCKPRPRRSKHEPRFREMFLHNDWYERR